MYSTKTLILTLQIKAIICPPLLRCGGNFGIKAMTNGCGVCTTNVVEDALSPSPDNPSKPGSY
jgi:hypothetical protein